MACVWGGFFFAKSNMTHPHLVIFRGKLYLYHKQFSAQLRPGNGKHQSLTPLATCTERHSAFKASSQLAEDVGQTPSASQWSAKLPSTNAGSNQSSNRSSQGETPLTPTKPHLIRTTSMPRVLLLRKHNSKWLICGPCLRSAKTIGARVREVHD